MLSQGDQATRSVRRSFVLPASLVEEAMALAPPGVKTNLNRIVVSALREFITRRRREQFEATMAAMAADPAIRTECASISEQFTAADADGLGGRAGR